MARARRPVLRLLDHHHTHKDSPTTPSVCTQPQPANRSTLDRASGQCSTEQITIENLFRSVTRASISQPPRTGKKNCPLAFLPLQDRNHLPTTAGAEGAASGFGLWRRLCELGLQSSENSFISRLSAASRWVSALLEESTGQRVTARGVAMFPSWFVERKRRNWLNAQLAPCRHD